MPNTKEIVVVESGWVFLADTVVPNKDPSAQDEWVLENASVVRQWGTTKGLGQIALQGVTTDTILDPCGNPTVPRSKVLFRIPCKW